MRSSAPLMRKADEAGHARHPGFRRCRGRPYPSGGGSVAPHHAGSTIAAPQTFEAFLGVNLIERTTRSSSLSSTGRGFLPQARRLIGIDTIDLVDPVVSRPMVLLTHRGAHLSPAAQALYDMV